MSYLKSFQKLEMDSDWLLRFFTLIPAVFILLAGAAAIWMYLFVMSLLPDSKPIVPVAGLIGEVTVCRDINGAPAIYGENSDDVAAVLGYVMAQDRLWQMDYLRRTGHGRLSEIFGYEALNGDHLMRTLRNGRRFEAPADPAERKWLERFVFGVNRYINLHLAKLPVEFSLLEYRPEPFTIADVQAILFALAVESSAAIRIDPVAAQLLTRFGKDKTLAFLAPDFAAPDPIVVPQLTGMELKGALFSQGAAAHPFFPGLRGGYAWSVGRTKTRAGRAMLGCSVYQTFSAPGFWYKAAITAKNFEVSGAFIPGTPYALVGANQHLSWACVLSPVDDADLFVEVLDSDEPTVYWKIDRWKKIAAHSETYQLRGGGSETRSIISTATGPLVTTVTDKAALSLRWAGAEGLGLSGALYKLNRSLNHKELQAGLKDLVNPCMSVVWAGEEGSFGGVNAGKLPVRCAGSDGLIPMPAWTGVHDWQGFLNFADTPVYRNTSSGVALVGGSRPGGSDNPVFMGSFWDDEARRQRLLELLSNTTEHSKESFQAIQNDTYSPSAALLTPVLVTTLGSKVKGKEADVLKMLAAWDYRLNKDSTAAAVFTLWYRALERGLTRRALGAEISVPGLDEAARARFVQTTVESLDDPERTEIFRKALTSGLTEGGSFMGDSIKRWKLGDMRSLRLNHPLASRSRFLESLYNVGPVSLNGGWDAINYADSVGPYRREITEGVTLKEVKEMTDPPQGYGVSSLGSSAHFFSSNYKDQIGLWLGGRLTRDPMFGHEPGRSATNTVLFKPTTAPKFSMGPQ